MRLRSYQRIHANNIFEAVFNHLIAITAPVWIPLLALYAGWLWLTAPPEQETPMSQESCAYYARLLHDAEKKLAGASLVGERKLAQKEVDERRKVVMGERWQRDCAKVKP
jgi:hypothetical protein